jgi:hypothetical protein
MTTPSDRMMQSMHEIFLLVIIASIAFALIDAANRAYTIDACHAHDPASDINPGHEAMMPPSQQQAHAAGKGL